MEGGVAGRRSDGAPGGEGQGSDGAVEGGADGVTGISEVRNGRAGPEALVRRGAESEDEEMAGTAMEEWVAVSSLPKGWRALARRMMREAGLAIGEGVAGRRESARRAVTARRAVAVEAGAAKQLAERDARAKARAEAAAARGGAQGG